MVHWLETPFHHRGSRCGLFSINLQTEEVQWSPGMYALLGVGRVAPTLALFRSLLQPEGFLSDAEILARADLDFAYKERCSVSLRDGTVRHLSIHMEKMSDETGTMNRILGIAYEI